MLLLVNMLTDALPRQIRPGSYNPRLSRHLQSLHRACDSATNGWPDN
jgi:hypothetical protein